MELWLTKTFTPFQQEFTINNNRLSHPQLWNVIITAVIVLYFWIYNVFLDLTLYFYNHIVLMKLCCIYNSVPSKPNEDLFITRHAEFGLA